MSLFLEVLENFPPCTFALIICSTWKASAQSRPTEILARLQSLTRSTSSLKPFLSSTEPSPPIHRREPSLPRGPFMLIGTFLL